jgi:hypothetical protein
MSDTLRGGHYQLFSVRVLDRIEERKRRKKWTLKYVIGVVGSFCRKMSRKLLS